ncbi:hypothetical protein TeGR_g12172, partial [Tetraparma gracilis]
ASLHEKYNSRSSSSSSSYSSSYSPSPTPSSSAPSAPTYQQQRGSPPGFLSSLKSVFGSDSGSLSILGVAAGLLACKLTGVSPWQALMMVNMLRGGGGYMQFGGGGLGGMGRRRRGGWF